MASYVRNLQAHNDFVSMPSFLGLDAIDGTVPYFPEPKDVHRFAKVLQRGCVLGSCSPRRGGPAYGPCRAETNTMAGIFVSFAQHIP